MYEPRTQYKSLTMSGLCDLWMSKSFSRNNGKDVEKNTIYNIYKLFIKLKLLATQ